MKKASWGSATELSRIIEESDKPTETPERQDAPVTIVHAVPDYLADAKAWELAGAMLFKLKIQLEKQFISWCKSESCTVVPEGSPRRNKSGRPDFLMLYLGETKGRHTLKNRIRALIAPV
jgi:hypothetical protein